MFIRSKKKRKKSASKKIDWQEAPDIKERVLHLLMHVEMKWIKEERIFCFRSSNSSTKALARTWSFPRLWQKALDTEAAYIIEVISERFDILTQKQKDRVLLHELAHIPKTFSGALLPHTKKGKGSFHDKLEKMIASYERQLL